MQDLSIAIEDKVRLISQNPYIFQKADQDNNLRRAVIVKLNSIYYLIEGDEVEILSFYANRKDPKANKLQ